MSKRYDVLTDIGVKLFEADSEIGILNLFKFLDKNYETKNNKKSNHLSQPAQDRLEKLETEFDNKKIVNDIAELSDEYIALKSIDKNYAKSIMNMASLTASGSLQSVGDKSLFASVGNNNTFTKAYINKSQLSKLN